MKRILTLFFLIAAVAGADTLKTDTELLEGVYIRETGSRYYAADPTTGEVRSFAKDEASVTFSEDREELLKSWREVSDEKKQAEEAKKDKLYAEYVSRDNDVKVFEKKGTSTWEMRNSPEVYARNYQEYLRNGYDPEADALRRKNAIYAPNIESLKYESYLNSQVTQSMNSPSGVYIAGGTPSVRRLPVSSRPIVFNYWRPIVLREVDSSTGSDRD